MAKLPRPKPARTWEDLLRLSPHLVAPYVPHTSRQPIPASSVTGRTFDLVVYLLVEALQCRADPLPVELESARVDAPERHLGSHSRLERVR